MQQVLSQGEALLQRQYSVRNGRRVPLTDRDKFSIAILCGGAVARLGLQQSAGSAHTLAAKSKVAIFRKLPPYGGGCIQSSAVVGGSQLHAAA
jgi:hypothetical protein